MSTIPLHPQTFEPAPGQGLGQAVHALVVTTTRIAASLRDRALSMGTAAKQRRQADEVDPWAVQSLATVPHFVIAQ